MTDAYATYPHLVDHLAPIWRALGDDCGTFWLGARRLLPYAEALGIDGARLGHVPNGDASVLVANHHDLDRLPPGRSGIFVEHGAGQRYADVRDHPSYSGGARREKVGLFLSLNATTASRDAHRTPHAPAVVVGSPRLDTLSAGHVRAARPVVAVCWHWDCGLVPETRWAWPHYRRAVVDLTQHFDVLGHGHPRVWPLLARAYEVHGIEPVQSFAEVMQRADVVVVDNTSAGPEAAALGLPVVWANAPWYRRDVHHGERFWTWPHGQVSCDDPADLAGAIVQALGDDSHAAQARERMVDSIYPAWTRGRSAELAAAACAAVTLI